MRTLEEIEKDIDKTRKHLRELYDEHNQMLEREVNIDKKVNDLCVNMKKWINYWTEDE